MLVVPLIFLFVYVLISSYRIVINVSLLELGLFTAILPVAFVFNKFVFNKVLSMMNSKRQWGDYILWVIITTVCSIIQLKALGLDI